MVPFHTGHGIDNLPEHALLFCAAHIYPPPGWTLERIEDTVYECLPFAHGGAAQAYLVVIHRAA